MFYFFADTNNAKNQPINDQPNNHDPTRARMQSYFALSFMAAKYAGVNMMTANITTAATYFNINKISFNDIIYIPYLARVPNSSSIRINWLYFAMRSVRDIEPVFI